MTTDGCIDPSAIEQVLSLGGKPLLVRLTTIFKDVGATRLAAAQRALVEGDHKALHRELHSIRSSSSNLGCIALSDSCLVVEAAILNEKTLDFESAMADVAAEMARAQEALATLTESIEE